MTEKNSKSFMIYAVSDATGDLSHAISFAAFKQFDTLKAQIKRFSTVQDPNRIDEIVQMAKNDCAVIIFTFVAKDLRQKLLDSASHNHVVAIDIMGPVLEGLSHYFHRLPSKEPGLQYHQAQNYFRRIQAVEFTVRHDEGLNADKISQADIVLLGISRCSKTPLSIYLAYHGLRCANIPIALGQKPPQSLASVDHQKLVGLTAKADTLVRRRTIRLKSLGRPDSEDYANSEHIQKELDYAHQIYQDLKIKHLIDISDKAIEEIAHDIMQKLDLIQNKH